MPIVPPLNTEAYPAFEELSQYLYSLQEAVPHLVKVFTIGESREGRPLLVAEMTNHGTGEAQHKAAVWIDGNSAGSELASSVACLAILQHLAAEHGRDEAVTDALDRFTFYVMPRLCPDEAELCLISGGPMGDEIEAGCEGEFEYIEPSDIDGDGRILQMRIEDEWGEWRTSKRDARVLVPRQPEDAEGTFYRLSREGLLPEGGRPGISPRRHSRRLEHKARLQFLSDVGNVGIVLSLRGSGDGISLNLVEDMVANDREILQIIARRLANVAETDCLEGDSTDPAAADLYQQCGILTLSSRVWSLPRTVGLGNGRSYYSESELLNIMRWVDRELGEEGFFDWKSCSHPQLDRVEVGGWNLLQTWLNPPVGEFLAEYCRVHVAMALSLPALLPSLSLEQYREETIGWSVSEGGSAEEAQPVRNISVKLGNGGFLPTWILESAKAKAVPIKVELELPEGCEVLSGQAVSNVGHLAGMVSAQVGALGNSVFAGTSLALRWRTLNWVVRGQGEIIIVASQPCAGVAECSSTVKRKETTAVPSYQSSTEYRSSSSRQREGVGRSAARNVSTATTSAVIPPPPAPVASPLRSTAKAVPYSGVRAAAAAVSSEPAVAPGGPQARNLNLIKGMAEAPAPDVEVADNAAEAVPLDLLHSTKGSVRPVKFASEASEESPRSPSSASANEGRSANAGGAMGGYRPIMRMRNRSSEEVVYTSGEYRAVSSERDLPERPSVERKGLVREDSPLRKEPAPASLGRVFGQSSTPKTAPAPAPRPALGRAVGQTDSERERYAESKPAEVTTFEGREVKPHSLLSSAKKIESEPSKASSEPAPPPKPAPPRPAGPVAPLLLRRNRANE